MALNKLLNSSVHNSRNEDTVIAPRRVLCRLGKRIAQVPPAPASCTRTWSSCISLGHPPKVLQPATQGPGPPTSRIVPDPGPPMPCSELYRDPAPHTSGPADTTQGRVWQPVGPGGPVYQHVHNSKPHHNRRVHEVHCNTIYNSQDMEAT